MELKDKVVVIIGGVFGLGQVIVCYMVGEKRVKVVLLDLNEEVGVAMVEELGEVNVIFCQIDVIFEESIDVVIVVIMDKFSVIYMDVNVVGILLFCKIFDWEGKVSSLVKYVMVINVNLMGVFNVMVKCVEQMVRNELDENGECGVIVNVFFGVVFEGQIGQSVYSGFKVGVNGMNIFVVCEFGFLGIWVNLIVLGLFGIFLVKGLDQKVQDLLIVMCEVFKCMGEVDEFVYVCVFLVENGYMNGWVLCLDVVMVMQVRQVI